VFLHVAGIFLDEKMLSQVKEVEDLEEVVKLHQYVKKIRKRQRDIKHQIGEMKAMF
jgi:hypothetical protein